MGKWYLFNVYTFCKSVCVIDVGPHMFYMGSPYIFYIIWSNVVGWVHSLLAFLFHTLPANSLIRLHYFTSESATSAVSLVNNNWLISNLPPFTLCSSIPFPSTLEFTFQTTPSIYTFNNHGDNTQTCLNQTLSGIHSLTSIPTLTHALLSAYKLCTVWAYELTRHETLPHRHLRVCWLWAYLWAEEAWGVATYDPHLTQNSIKVIYRFPRKFFSFPFRNNFGRYNLRWISLFHFNLYCEITPS